MRRVRFLHLAPFFAFVALAAWAVASPIGAGPDDDYHLVSIWCAGGDSAECSAGSEITSRSVTSGLDGISCYAFHENESAACQADVLNSGKRFETSRGNFSGEYPPAYYVSMNLFASSDIQVSALTMRLVNAALFVGLTTTLFALLPLARRPTLVWGWLVSIIPLGIFLIPSNNPSGWAITGVGTAFLALLGWFETTGRKRWVLGALYVVGVVMAAGSRGDAGVYVVGASIVAGIITWTRGRAWILLAALPMAGILIAITFFAQAGQSGVAAIGFSGGGDAPGGGPGAMPDRPTGLALAAYNLLMLPHLWTGVWGTWPLGWFDTVLPAIVPWASTAAFIVVGFAGLGRLNWRKAISILGVLVILVCLPVYVLTVGGMTVGEALQPRYLLPLILLLSLLLVTMPPSAQMSLTRIQRATVLGALAIANLVALQVNLRRYVTGADQQGPNLDTGAEWWWSGVAFGPTAVWAVGVIAFSLLLASLWSTLRPAAKSSVPV